MDNIFLLIFPGGHMVCGHFETTIHVHPRIVVNYRELKRGYISYVKSHLNYMI